MLTILLSHKSLDQYEIKIRAEIHFNKMDGNPLYAAFQVLVTQLKATIDRYSVALTNAAGGSTEDKKIRLRVRTELDDVITTLGRTLELKANELPEVEGRTLVDGAGFELRQPPARKNLTFLEKPTNLVAVDVLGFAGTVKVSWKKNADTINIGIEFQLTNDGAWQNGTFSTGKTTLLTGLPSGTYVNIKIYGIGRNGLKSDVTDFVTVLVS